MGRLVHFEIHAEQPEELAAFYAKLFDWTFQKWDGPIEYWMIFTGDAATPGINGGLVRRRGPQPPVGQPVNAFVCTVDVADLDATWIQALSLGGSEALPKMPIPGVGWLAYLRDPDGNLLGIMQADPSANFPTS